MEQLDEIIFSAIESLRNNQMRIHQLSWKLKNTINYFIRQRKPFK